MLDFRKVILAAAVAGLGLVSTASAQISACTVTSGALQGIRAEGMTEQLQPLSIGSGTTATTCVGSANTATVSFQITTNAPIANAIVSATTNSTDALATAVGFAGASTAAVQGVKINATTLQFTFTVTPGASVGGSTITISNIRVDASSVPVGTIITAAGTGVAGMAFGSGTTSSASPAVTQTSLAKPVFTGYSNVAICTTKAGDVNALGTVQIQAAFVAAFTTDAQEFAKEPTGITSNPITAANALGSRIALTFANLTNGVTYYLPTSVTFTGTAGGPTSLILVTSPSVQAVAVAGGIIGGTTANTSGSNTGLQQGINAGGTTGTSSASVSGVSGFTPTAGTFTAYYAVSTDNTTGVLDGTGKFSSTIPIGAPAFSTITLYEIVPSISLTVASGAPTVSAALVGSTPGTVGYGVFNATNTTATQVALASGSTTITAGTLTNCNTTLLFPYVVMTAGYDTGIAITNAGLGTSVTGGSINTTAAGVCSLNFWGAGSLGGTAITPFSITGISVAAGQVYANTLTGLFSANATAAAPAANGFAGYATAVCNFQGGHGFAFISDGAGGTVGKGLSQGYLAPILTTVINNTTSVPTTPQF